MNFYLLNVLGVLLSAGKNEKFIFIFLTKTKKQKTKKQNKTKQKSFYNIMTFLYNFGDLLLMQLGALRTLKIIYK